MTEQTRKVVSLRPKPNARQEQQRLEASYDRFVRGMDKATRALWVIAAVLAITCILLLGGHHG